MGFAIRRTMPTLGLLTLRSQPVFDWLFKTYYLPSDKEPGPYGIDTHMPETYVGQLIQPFLKIKPEETSAESS